MKQAKETAVLLLAHGTPDRIEEMKPFLDRIRGGRPVRPEVLAEVQRRYARIGGRSPLTDITRAQARALEEALGGPSGGFRTFVGMKHWQPTILEAAEEIHKAGLQRWIVVTMAPQHSRLSTDTYREQVEKAASALERRPEIRHVPSWHCHPGLLEVISSRVREALDRFPEDERSDVPVLLTAHSLPARILEWNDPYPGEFKETAEGVMALLGKRPWRIAYQSQGMTPEPWLGPTVEEVLQEMQGDGVRGVVIAPVGFVADHVEVLYDIDVQFKESAAKMGIRLERAGSLNDDPRFIEALASVVRDAADSLEKERRP